MIKKQRGGTRLNSGAKPKYNEPTTTIAFRVPISHKERIFDMVKTELESIKAYIDYCKTEEYNFKNELAETHKPGL